MVTKNYRNASRIIRAAITESFEDMMTDFISLLCIFVCRRLFLGHFARDMRTLMAQSVYSMRILSCSYEKKFETMHAYLNTTEALQLIL